MTQIINKNGEPDISICGLQIWVYNRAYPDSIDAFDSNWVNSKAICVSAGAIVEVNGTIFHLLDIKHLMESTESLYNKMEGNIDVKFYEPYLKFTFIVGKKTGSIEFELFISPNHLIQEHTFSFEIDQTYLPILVQQCKNILNKYPLI